MTAPVVTVFVNGAESFLSCILRCVLVSRALRSLSPSGVRLALSFAAGEDVVEWAKGQNIFMARLLVRRPSAAEPPVYLPWTDVQKPRIVPADPPPLAPVPGRAGRRRGRPDPARGPHGALRS